MSKVFEKLLLVRCEEYLHTTNNQFGFKRNHATDMSNIGCNIAGKSINHLCYADVNIYEFNPMCDIDI